VLVVYWTVLGALILAAVHAPMAALLAWPLYRLNIRERVAYAIAGAVAALPVPVAFQIADGTLLKQERIEANALVIAWFAISGAFGGFKAARALQQETG
jgi:hypothetical protein